MMFSIIVPIYKIEKYLPECIESVQKQSFDDYELILVDDGSPDGCGAICDKYAEDDRHISVIHKKNGGLSAARNSGIEAAKGDYIIFLDGDDVLYDGILERLDSELSKNTDADIFIGNVLHWCEGSETVYFDNKTFFEFAAAHSLFDLCEKYAENNILIPWRAWQSVYRSDFIKNNDLLFDSDIIGAEDCDYFFRILPHIKKYVLSDCTVVKYRAFREGSIVNAPSYKAVIGQLKVFKKTFDFSEAFSNKKLMRRYFADKFANIIILADGLKNPDEKKDCLNFIRQNKNILSHCSNKPKYLIARSCWSVFGFERGNRLLKKIHR